MDRKKGEKTATMATSTTIENKRRRSADEEDMEQGSRHDHNNRARKDDADANAAGTASSATTPEGVVRVEIAVTGKAHCGWCDTIIAQGTPRVVERQYHAAMSYIRNRGASCGYCPVGLISLSLFLHPQCTYGYGYDDEPDSLLDVPFTSRRRGLAFSTRLGAPCRRCQESKIGKTWYVQPSSRPSSSVI
eukprot:scaffold15108_cov180-Amphora_coffeaeformis.AAC.93